MTIFNPMLAELMSKLKTPPVIPTLRNFSDICGAMRNTHDFFMYQNEQFNTIYSNAVKEGKLTSAGLADMKKEFESAYNQVFNTMRDLIANEIKKWKDAEQKNVYAVVNKAPTEEQARLLEVVCRRQEISQAEVELWAKQFGDNYACSCAFRDFAKNKGFYVAYSNFTNAEERITAIEDATEYLNKMLSVINQSKESSYSAMAFYGVDENGKSYEGSLAHHYAEILEGDSAFKPQTIKIKPIRES